MYQGNSIVAREYVMIVHHLEYAHEEQNKASICCSGY